MERAETEYDIIVVGAGPAGAACAIRAAHLGAKVLLLEKDRFPRHKVCGEFVSGESLRLLDSLLACNSAAKAHFHNRPSIDNAQVFLDGKVARLPVHPAARSIPRFDLDAALFQSARQNGVEAREGVTVREMTHDHGSTSIVHSDQGSFSAKAAVNATGRWSVLSQHDVAGKEKWIGLKAHFAEAEPSSSVDLYCFEGGYCGVQPVASDAVNVCAMVKAGVARSMGDVFALHPALWRRSRHWAPLFPPVTTSPLYFRRPKTCNQGILLAGDAAGFIDPFAGDGISLALQSGALAAESLAAYVCGQASLVQSQQAYQTAYAQRLDPAFRNAARLRRLLAAPMWIRSTLLSLIGTRPVAQWVVRRTRARAS